MWLTGPGPGESRSHQSPGSDWSRQVTWPEHWPLIGRGRVTWPQPWPLIGHHPLSSWRPPLLSRGGWDWLGLGWQLWGSPWPGHQVFSVLSVHQHHQPRHHSGQQVCDDHQGDIRVWGVICCVTTRIQWEVGRLNIMKARLTYELITRNSSIITSSQRDYHRFYFKTCFVEILSKSINVKWLVKVSKTEVRLVWLKWPSHVFYILSNWYIWWTKWKENGKKSHERIKNGIFRIMY